MASTILLKLSSASTMSDASFATAVPRGRVVHAVASHRDDLAALLQETHDVLLMLRLGARAHAAAGGGQRGELLRLGHRAKLAPGERPSRDVLRGVEDADVDADRLRGEPVIAGDDDDADPRARARGDGAPHLGPRRVSQPGEADEHEVALDRGVPARVRETRVRGVGRRAVVRRERAEGRARFGRQREASKRVGAHRLRAFHDGGARRLRQRHDVAVRELDESAALEDVLGRALDEELVGVGVRLAAARRRDHDAHGFAVAVKLQRRHLLEVVVLRLRAALELRREHAERALRGLPRALRVPVRVHLDHRVVAAAAHFAHRGERRVQRLGLRRLRRADDGAVARVVRRPGDVVRLEDVRFDRGHDELHRGHVVRGQRAGLIRADYGRAPERLDRLQLANDGVLLRHLPRPEREAGGDDRGQALRDRRDRERDGDLEVKRALGEVELDVVRNERPRRALPRDEKLVIHEPNEEAHEPDPPRELVPEPVQLLLQRRVLLLLARRLDLRLDLTNLGSHPGVRDDRDARALRRRGASEEHAPLRLQLRVRVVDRVDILVHRDGLPGQRRLLESDRRCLQGDDARVRGDAVARAHLHDVPRDEISRLERVVPLAVAKHPRGVRLHLFERLERVLRVRFLPHADDGVEDQDEEDDARLDEVHEIYRRARRAIFDPHERERHRGGREQDLYERVVELLEHELPQRLAVLLVELVRAVSRERVARGGGRQTVGGIDAVRGRDVGRGRGPRRGEGGGGGRALLGRGRLRRRLAFLGRHGRWTRATTRRARGDVEPASTGGSRTSIFVPPRQRHRQAFEEFRKSSCCKIQYSYYLRIQYCTVQIVHRDR
eukprot:29686-Pelagococcus_subviridis.AAC.2